VPLALPWQRQVTRPGSAAVGVMDRVRVRRAIHPPVTWGILGVSGGRSGTPTTGGCTALADASQIRWGPGTLRVPRSQRRV